MSTAHVDGEPLGAIESMLFVGDIPRQGAQRFASRTALIHAERKTRVSYDELDRQSDAFAAWAKAQGLPPGARVAYLGRNSDLFYSVLFGAIRANIILVPVNWRLAAPEIGFQIEDSEARWVICDSEFTTTVNSAVRSSARPPQILLTEEGDASSNSSAQSLRWLLGQPAPAFAIPRDLDQIVLHIYTSGTTGTPKGTLLSHGGLSIARHAELISPRINFVAPGAILLSPMPNFHVGGLSWVLIGLVRFGTVVITGNPAAPWLLSVMNEYGIEHCFIVATVIRALVEEIKAGAAPPRTLRCLFYGAMPIGEALLREALSILRCSFAQFFGMTEITGSATFLAPEDHDPANPHLLRSVGKPYPGMSIEIRDPERHVRNIGEHGEIWVRTPTRMSGYWKAPEATSRALIDGWYATGDGGYLDRDGYLFLTDRIKDVIVSGGENIYPAEVEESLRRHPSVLDAACIGVSDAKWGESIVAVIEGRLGQAPQEDDLRNFIRSQIASFKCPKHYFFVDALPRTAAGKVKRAELRREFKGSL